MRKVSRGTRTDQKTAENRFIINLEQLITQICLAICLPLQTTFSRTQPDPDIHLRHLLPEGAESAGVDCRGRVAGGGADCSSSTWRGMASQTNTFVQPLVAQGHTGAWEAGCRYREPNLLLYPAIAGWIRCPSACFLPCNLWTYPLPPMGLLFYAHKPTSFIVAEV